MVLQSAIFPPIRTKNRILVEAPYGLRKVEAELINEGFDVLTVDPDYLDRYISEAGAPGIHVMGPFGLGPASTRLARILRTGNPRYKKSFHKWFNRNWDGHFRCSPFVEVRFGLVWK